MFAWRGIALRVAVILAVAGPARAEPADPHIAKARAHIDELALDLAQTELDLALRAGDSDRTRLVEIHRMLGIVHAGLDRPERAVDEFRIVLALDPRAEVPAELGPKIVEPFADARASMQGRAPLAVRLEPYRAGNAELVVVVESDPLAMVKQARGRFVVQRGGESIVVGPGASRIALAIPAGATRASVAVLDEHDNRLAELDVALAVRDTSEQPGIFGRWTVWGGVAIGAGAVGLGFALAARSTQAELDELEQMAMPPFSRVDELDDRGRRRTLIANIAFGAAGAAAVVSTILFVRRPGARVAVAPAPDGALVLISGGF
ncbi:MAG: tetratricopeptide repeat protein [Kofleriaceae bacterium]|nr:tetratricopeptide repeat protein [Kofleriaceae bacterium]